MFYFEDVFNKIIVLWKEEYRFSTKKDTTTAISTLANDFLEIDWYIMEECPKLYGNMDAVMLFIIYQVLTDFALEIDKSKKLINIKEIPINRFEKQFISNFECLKNGDHHEMYEEFRKEYQGYRNPAFSKIDLGEYLELNTLILRRTPL